MLSWYPGHNPLCQGWGHADSRDSVASEVLFYGISRIDGGSARAVPTSLYLRGVPNRVLAGKLETRKIGDAVNVNAGAEIRRSPVGKKSLHRILMVRKSHVLLHALKRGGSAISP